MAQPLANSPALSVTVDRGHADWPHLEQCQATPNLFGAVACLQSAPKHPAQCVAGSSPRAVKLQSGSVVRGSGADSSCATPLGGEAVQTTAPDPLAFKEIALRGLIHPPFLWKGVKASTLYRVPSPESRVPSPESRVPSPESRVPT